MIFDNNGAQEHDGVEFTVFGQPISNTQISGGITWMDAQQLDTAAGTLDGNWPVAIPDLRATLHVEYEFQTINGLAASAGLNHTGQQYLDAANTQEVPSWTTGDLGLRYGFGVQGMRMTARLDVQNVTDERYWSSAVWALSPGEPRSFILSLTSAF